MAYEVGETMAAAMGHDEGAHDVSIKDVGPAKAAYKAEDVRVRYTILQTPPILETAFLGFQVISRALKPQAGANRRRQLGRHQADADPQRARPGL
jgi:hypothetical protein